MLVRFSKFLKSEYPIKGVFFWYIFIYVITLINNISCIFIYMNMQLGI